MSTKIDDGGPAFPVAGSSYFVRGMSLRVYFAAKAMQAFIQNLKPNPDSMGYIFPTEWRPIVSAAWNIADAMLAARKERP